MCDIYRRFDTPGVSPTLQKQSSQPQNNRPQNQMPQNYQEQTQQTQNRQQKGQPQQPQNNRQQIQNHQSQSNQSQTRQQCQSSQTQNRAVQSSHSGHSCSNSHLKSKGSRKKPSGIAGILQSLLPPTVYNPDTKKILGFLSAEDLLLVALIFLFMANDDEDNTLMVLALVFVLISDYIDLSDFSF